MSACDLWLEGLVTEFKTFNLPTYQFEITKRQKRAIIYPLTSGLEC